MVSLLETTPYWYGTRTKPIIIGIGLGQLHTGMAPEPIRYRYKTGASPNWHDTGLSGSRNYSQFLNPAVSTLNSTPPPFSIIVFFFKYFF